MDLFWIATGFLLAIGGIRILTLVIGIYEYHLPKKRQKNSIVTLCHKTQIYKRIKDYDL